MLVCTEKLYTEILSSDLRIYLNLVILAGIVEPRMVQRAPARCYHGIVNMQLNLNSDHLSTKSQHHEIASESCT